jgi:hypothetical protein
VDYQPDGMSANIWYQYRNSPKSFAETRRAVLQAPGMTFFYRLKTAAHYVSSSMISKNRKFLQETPAKGLTLLALPLGVAITAMVYMKTKG